jgi:alpha-beta hydrolase superfamily lysophospholipase
VDEQFVDLSETKVFVRAWGERDARPALYWHGVFIAPRASMTINEAAPWLAEHGLRVLALDAPGFGKSPALEPALTIRTPSRRSSRSCWTHSASSGRRL